MNGLKVRPRDNGGRDCQSLPRSAARDEDPELRADDYSLVARHRSSVGATSRDDDESGGGGHSRSPNTVTSRPNGRRQGNSRAIG